MSKRQMKGGRARLYAGHRKLTRIEARTKDGKPAPTSFTEDPDATVLIKFPYNPQGTGFRVTWQ